MTPAHTDSCALELRAIDKRFGGVHALRGATLSVRPGEIMGLCGENGAGKSTLLKVLAGVHPHGSYTGEVLVGGRARRLTRPADAHRAGIAVVHQELTLVPELTVAQNLMLGREPRRYGLVDDTRMEAAARSDLARFGVADRIDVAQPVGQLGIGVQQIVEIVRALPQGARILVLDEPTAALTADETSLLLRWLRSLRDRGAACVYVSHRLDEVFSLCDRITVLRNGNTVAAFETAQTTPEQVVAAMVGRSLDRRRRAAPIATTCAPILELDDLRVRSSRDRYALDGISLSVHPGEVVALCGAMGSGRTALLSSLFGCARGRMSGEVRIAGAAVTIDSPIAAMRHGLGYLPEDRKRCGMVPLMSVAQNLALPSLSSVTAAGPRARAGLVDEVAERRLAERLIRSLSIVGAASSSVATLSGGNQQKVVLGKWLERRPRLLLLDEPTRGVDVGARDEIYELLDKLVAQGIAILFASSDLTEVLHLSQRICILRSGRLVCELDTAAVTEAEIAQLTTGATNVASSHVTRGVRS